MNMNEVLTPAQTSRPISMEHIFYLYDDIGEPTNYIELVECLNTASEADLIVLKISTNGGNLNGALAIIHGIRSTVARVVGIAEGMVASAGTLILLSCHEIAIREFSSFLYHDGSSGYEGKLNENRKMIEAISTLYKEVAMAIYQPFFSEEEIEKVLDGSDLFQTAQQMSDRIAKVYEVQDNGSFEAPTDQPGELQQLNEKNDLIDFDSLPSESEVPFDEVLSPPEYFPEEVTEEDVERQRESVLFEMVKSTKGSKKK